MTSSTDDTVDLAVRTILRDLTAKIEISSQRVLLGANPDDIHDLRVANRRTRTVLGQVPDVFPKATLKPFRQGFRRIGEITGTCRDLDVWLEAIDDDRGTSGPGQAILLGPLEDLVRLHRDEARAQVVADIVAPWFPALVYQWNVFLEMPPEALTPTASRNIAPVAAARILKAHRRLLKHGKALPEAPLASQFHRLRIDGKKLRYLLEFFGGLFDSDRCDGLIEDLKRIQDVLGGINDREIQLRALERLEKDLDPATILAIGRHRRFLQNTLEGFRSDFTAEFRAFAEPKVTQAFRNLEPDQLAKGL